MIIQAHAMDIGIIEAKFSLFKHMYTININYNLNTYNEY